MTVAVELATTCPEGQIMTGDELPSGTGCDLKPGGALAGDYDGQKKPNGVGPIDKQYVVPGPNGPEDISEDVQEDKRGKPDVPERGKK